MLLNASRRIWYDIIVLQETKATASSTRRMEEEELIVLGEKVNKKNIRGVGFIINKSIKLFVESHAIICPRIAIIRIWVNTMISMINGYAPTSAAADEDKDQFCADLEKKTYYKFVCADFNTTINGRHSSSPRIRCHGDGATSENGERLTDLFNTCNLYHGNSFFQKKASSRWTWISLNRSTKSELGHILTHQRWRRCHRSLLHMQ